MQLQQEAGLIERFRLRDRDELYALPLALVEKMNLLIEADEKAQAGATKK